MATTLTDLRARVVSRLGLTVDDEMIPNTELDRSINNGLMNMSTEFDFPWLQVVSTFPTVANQQTYALPARLTRIQTIYTASDVVNGFPLTNRQFPFIAQFLNVQPSMPTDFAVVANTLYLSPIPSNIFTITMLYVQTENTLVSGSDTVLCPDQYIDVPVTYAAIDQAIRMKDTTLLQSLLEWKKEQLARISDNVIKATVAPAILMRDDF